MAEREKEEFVVTDRRKFRMEGDRVEHNPNAAPSEPEAERVAETQPESVAPAAQESAAPDDADFGSSTAKEVSSGAGGGAIETAGAADPALEEDPAAEQGPTAADFEASQRAYQATSDRMDDLMRATNPGAPHEGPFTFERAVQSLYFSAIMQLGLNTPPGQQMRVDLAGARNTIDMLAVIAEKVKGNTTAEEDKLLQAALFEVRMSFLELTRMLAQQAQAQAAQGNAPGAKPGAGATAAGKIKL